jgi:hypothetical protein
VVCCGAAAGRRRAVVVEPGQGVFAGGLDAAGAEGAHGSVLKRKDGRRNRYQIQAHLPLPEPASQEPAIGEVLALLAGASAAPQSGPDHRSRPHGNADRPPVRPVGLDGTAVSAAAPHEHTRHQQASGKETP